VFVAFEESEDEIASNAASLGFDVPALVARRQLVIRAATASPSNR
jgi:KaiC/GvpD/RAD55 family RecA-like ATPase